MKTVTDRKRALEARAQAQAQEGEAQEQDDAEEDLHLPPQSDGACCGEDRARTSPKMLIYKKPFRLKLVLSSGFDFAPANLFRPSVNNGRQEPHCTP